MTNPNETPARTSSRTLVALLSRLDRQIEDQDFAKRIQVEIASVVRPMRGAPSWPNRRVHRLPRGFTPIATTITDASVDAAFSDSIVAMLGPYARVVYVPISRSALLAGCPDATEEECAPTLRSFK
jgi:hypothetical protein